jgi:hypothetical protein
MIKCFTNGDEIAPENTEAVLIMTSNGLECAHDRCLPLQCPKCGNPLVISPGLPYSGLISHRAPIVEHLKGPPE